MGEITKSLKIHPHSVSLVFGNLDDLGKLDIAPFDLAVLVEDVAQSSGEDTLDLDDLIAGTDEVLESAQQGQSRANSALAIVQRRAVGVARLGDSLPQLVLARGGLLVRRDNVDTEFQDLRVQGGNRV